jgi:hypothetical protein
LTSSTFAREQGKELTIFPCQGALFQSLIVMPALDKENLFVCTVAMQVGKRDKCAANTPCTTVTPNKDNIFYIGFTMVTLSIPDDD